MDHDDRDRVRAELHTHSTASDGDYDPETVAELVAERGVELWALTDHDNCDGCEAARGAARERDVEFLPGIEISAYRGHSIHVLGYGVEPESPAIEELSTELLEARRLRMREMLDALREHGVDLAFETVASLADGSPLSRSHLSEALLSHGSVDSRDEAFDRFIGADAPAYVPVGWPSIPEAIDYIHAAGGAAVLAHPGRYDIDAQIPDWVDAGLDGLEVAHPEHGGRERERYEKMADELDLVATKGSDFHGRGDAPWSPFGDVELERRRVDALREAVARYS